MRVRFAAPALRHLDEIHSFIAADNPAAASRGLGDIRKAVTLLQIAPNVGRRGEVDRTREWVVRQRPYVIVYRIEPAEDLLTVLGICHTARRRP
ncbi:type II toxin-antitoxin system RelE/ParE family toxin [Xanthobacter aminoxidans]|uniref:type II toxin-antitoxin system RelE/ParE family toxin n=1 Tax=Xanthobacter aminoxidans TaxID=186280 RepID=UPI00372CF1D7